MEQSIENVNLLVSGATGPLAKQLDAYIAWLDRNQYAISLMRIKVLQVLAFDRWLKRRDIALGNLNESHILRYQRRLSRRYGSRKYGLRHIETRRRELFNLEQLLDFLRQQGACALSPAAQQTPIDIISSEFEHHLRSERGLANETVSRYTTTARQFLADRFGDSPVTLVYPSMRCITKPLENALDKRIPLLFGNTKCHFRCPVQKCLDLLQGL